MTSGGQPPANVAQSLLAGGAVVVLLLGGVATLAAARTGLRTAELHNSDDFVSDARSFLDNYRCVEDKLESLAPAGGPIILDVNAVDDELQRQLLAMAAIGTFELTANGPILPVLVATTQPEATCGVDLAWAAR
jgi:hypothetical protein